MVLSHMTTVRLLLVFLLLGNVNVHGQPVFSRSAARFHFWDWPLQTDSFSRAVSLPHWFPVAAGAPRYYIGAVNGYGIGSLTEGMVGGRMPIRRGAIGWEGWSTGDAIYRSTVLQTGLVRVLSPTLWLGSSLGFWVASARGYGSRGRPLASLSLGGYLGNNTVWALSGENIRAGSSKPIGEVDLPLQVRLGVAQAVSARLSFFGGMDWAPSLGTGALLRARYRFSSDWSMHLGWGWWPDQWVVGVDRKFARVTVSLGFSEDPVLGSSFSFYVTWRQAKTP